MKTVSKYIFLSLCLFLFKAEASETALDYLLVGGKVYDGQSIDSQSIDIGIQGDQIVAVGDLKNRPAKRRIDVPGLIVQPGIIDAHTHSDITAFQDAKFEHALRQGITTIVTGNCGMSGFPITDKNSSESRSIWAHEGVTVDEAYRAEDFESYSRSLEGKKPTLNIAPMIGHGNLRTEVNGLKPGALSPEALRQETELLKKNLEEGAFGLSFGLAYIPGIYTDQTELLELTRTAKEAGVPVTFHLGSEGRELEESVNGVIDLARKSGATVVISHFKAAGKDHWDKFFPVMEQMAIARKDGLELYVTVYPYTAAQTELGALLPTWFYSATNRRDLLQDETAMARLKEELKGRKFDPGVFTISVLAGQKNKTWEGKAIHEFAKSRGLNNFEGMLALLDEEDFGVSIFAFGQHPYLVREALKQNFAMNISDTIAELSTHPHPRAFGSFPTYLHDLSLDSSALPLGEAIRKITSLPARVYGIQKRGIIEEGAFADIMIWDPASYKSRANYQDPRVLAEGVKYLMINGQLVIDDFNLQEAEVGRVLRRK